jgi:hypothetical protein
MREDINESLALIGKKFNITSEGKLNDFLGCEIVRDPAIKQCWLLQPHLINKLKITYGEELKKVRRMLTAGTPRQVLKKVEVVSDELRLNPEEMFRYRSGVGSLLYILKHSRPELSNPIRELTKGMHLAGPHHYKEMLRVMKWLLDTPNLGLKMKPVITKNSEGSINWILKGICDSTWGSEKQDGKSVTGYILYFMGVPISWKSKAQPLVTLSSSEAEYVAASELLKEIKYTMQILDSIGVKVDTPVRIYIDNTGAIQMARNNTSYCATRHVNVRFHFVREYQEEGKIELVFVRSEDNDADILTKNGTRAEIERHAPKLIELVPGRELLEL